MATKKDISPAGSFYAISDEEDGYDTVAPSGPGRGVKLIRAKSKVYMHPTPQAADNVPGYIALLQQKSAPADRVAGSSLTDDAVSKPPSSDYLFAWVPDSSLGEFRDSYHKADMSDDGPTSSYLVTPPRIVTEHPSTVGESAFAIPLSAVYSVTVRQPNAGLWHGSVIINTRSGNSFPALFFHDNECLSTTQQRKKRTKDNFEVFSRGGHLFWGGDEVIRWLNDVVHVERATSEPNIHLIEPSDDDLFIFNKDTKKNKKTAAEEAADKQFEPIIKFVSEQGWNMLAQFSRVTNFAKRTGQAILDNPRTPDQLRRFVANPDIQTLQEEYDSARIYLARWAMTVAEHSERDRRRRIWTAKDVQELERTELGDFELLSGVSGLSFADRRQPVTIEEWDSFFDPVSGSLAKTIDEVKERIFHGGFDAEDGVRKEAWPFIMDVYPWYSTADERKAQLASLRDDYHRLKQGWWERLDGLGGESEEGEWWREQRNRIEKDVHRTDRNVAIFHGDDIPHPDPKSPFADVGTNLHLEQLKELLLTYNEYNKDLGYVQGMSDLLAPVYAVVQDDALAFWCFKGFMDRMERNFLKDQSGMRTQLVTLDQLVHFMDPKLYDHLQKADSTNFFFFFRMLLVWFKREFEWEDNLRLWEALWTDYLTNSFHLFLALAILEKHRDVIMNHLTAFDEVLKYMNELSCTMDLNDLLVRAERLFNKFHRMVDAVDKKTSFPKPPTSPTSAASTGAKDKDKAELVVTPELRKLLSRNVEAFYVSASKRKELAK